MKGQQMAGKQPAGGWGSGLGATALAAVALTVVVACERPTSGTASEPAAVLWVVDGDTVEIEVDGQEAKVRLLALDAPETGACGSETATDRLTQLLPAGTLVELVPDPVADDVDRYGRRLAYLELDGVDVGEQLVDEGLTGVWWPASEPEPTRADGYGAAMAQARAAGVGSWSNCEALGRD